MYIKSLSLINFKKHSKLDIEFSDKLNILFGNNDAGKSCVIEAIKWLFFSEGRDIRKEETKKTTVSVILDSNVKITKIRSASVNAYILNIPGQEEKRFDAVGKNIPDEIKEALQVRTISIDNEEIILNIADQITLPFLLGSSATFRSKLFNKLTGSNLIDKTLQSFNKDILKISRESKLELEHLEKQKTSLSEVVIQKNKLENLYGNFKKQFKKIKALQVRYEQVNEYSLKLNEINNDLKKTENKLKKIKIVPDELLKGIEEKINNLNKYTDLYTKIKDNNTELKNVEKQLNSLKIVDVDTVELRSKIERLSKIKKLYSQVIDNKRVREELDNKLKTIAEAIIEGEKKYKDILKEMKICPLCKQDIKL